jgi:hypothetical protein
VGKQIDDAEVAAGKLLLEGLSWAGSNPSANSILNYDKDTQTIIVDELGLMRLIQIANPIQQPRRIKLGGGEK